VNQAPGQLIRSHVGRLWKRDDDSTFAAGLSVNKFTYHSSGTAYPCRTTCLFFMPYKFIIQLIWSFFNCYYPINHRISTYRYKFSWWSTPVDISRNVRSADNFYVPSYCRLWIYIHRQLATTVDSSVDPSTSLHTN